MRMTCWAACASPRRVRRADADRQADRGRALPGPPGFGAGRGLRPGRPGRFGRGSSARPAWNNPAMLFHTWTFLAFFLVVYPVYLVVQGDVAEAALAAGRFLRVLRMVEPGLPAADRLGYGRRLPGRRGDGQDALEEALAGVEHRQQPGAAGLLQVRLVHRRQRQCLVPPVRGAVCVEPTRTSVPEHGINAAVMVGNVLPGARVRLPVAGRASRSTCSSR